VRAVAPIGRRPVRRHGKWLLAKLAEK
jgi:hypothetical protein